MTPSKGVRGQSALPRDRFGGTCPEPHRGTPVLTEVQVRAAKASEKKYKLFDSRGLYLLVEPNGGRYWRLKYRLQGRERLIALGVYPDVPLKRAREKRDEIRRQVADGIDPAARRQAAKAALRDSFKALAQEYFEVKKKSLASITYNKRLKRFEDFVFPYLGKKPITAITAPDYLSVLKKVEARGKHETAHRLRSEGSQIFRYAIATGRAERDICTDLRGALAPVVVRNHSAITDPTRIGELLRAIDGYRGHRVPECALKLAPLVFVRPGELRRAEWGEFDLDNSEWRIPAHRMKMRELHIVPLSRQALAILRELHPHTGTGRYVLLPQKQFPV